ncbi:MAG: hypothetical protein RLZZ555_1993 [Pseudomonadota bacterium]
MRRWLRLRAAWRRQLPAGWPGISLFWRNWLALALILLGCLLAWLQSYRALEFEPRALQSARQIASLVNLSRAALRHADAVSRVALIKTWLDEEEVQISVREPEDSYEPYDQSAFGRKVSAELTQLLGKGTLVARRVNGREGLWVGFRIGRESFWLLTDPKRVGAVERSTWLVWLAIAAALSLLGAALLARLVNQPLKELQIASTQVREGDFDSVRLDEGVRTHEIREVNIGFNRMARQLGQAEQDRVLMLAGISHDLRTPLARLRLEVELSVSDETARDHMVGDIEQVDATINKFMDYARPLPVRRRKIDLSSCVDDAVRACGARSPLLASVRIEPGIVVLGDSVELRRVFTNLLENALRYARGPDGTARVEVDAEVQAQKVIVTLHDNGPGVPAEQLPRLTQPFFRGDAARTAASGSGLGLAIVNKAVARMGGQLLLRNHPLGGLVAELVLLRG